MKLRSFVLLCALSLQFYCQASDYLSASRDRMFKIIKDLNIDDNARIAAFYNIKNDIAVVENVDKKNFQVVHIHEAITVDGSKVNVIDRYDVPINNDVLRKFISVTDNPPILSPTGNYNPIYFYAMSYNPATQTLFELNQDYVGMDFDVMTDNGTLSDTFPVVKFILMTLPWILFQ